VITDVRSRVVASLALLATVVSMATPARGDEVQRAAGPAPATPTTSGAPAAAATSLALMVDTDAIDAEPLKQLLEDDLSIPIELSTTSSPPVLSVHASGASRVALVFGRPDGSEIRRSLELPRRRTLATETVAYAAANLLRDEAADLLATLQKAAPAPPPPPAPATPPAPAPVGPPPSPCSRPADLPFGADFVPFAGTSSVLPDGVRILSVNLLGGLAGGLHGLELGAGINIERRFMCGVQLAGLANAVSGPVEGVQLAPFNFASGTLQGVQLGVVAIAVRDVEGLQAGVGNLSLESMKGAQVGPLNLVTSPLFGAQVGVTNVVTDQVAGAQIGVVNVATGRVKGTQIGVVNYADAADAPIGLVSVVRHGRTDIQAWGTESGLALAGVRHGTSVLHNVYGAGIELGGEREWALVLGLGLHGSLARWLGLDVDLLQTWLQKRTPGTGNVELSTLQAAFGIPLGAIAEVMVAPTFNVLYGDDRGTGVAPPWSTFDLSNGGSSFVRGWPGLSGGLRLRLQ
jgi:hypothetical protein